MHKASSSVKENTLSFAIRDTTFAVIEAWIPKESSNGLVKATI